MQHKDPNSVEGLVVEVEDHRGNCRGGDDSEEYGEAKLAEHPPLQIGLGFAEQQAGDQCRRFHWHIAWYNPPLGFVKRAGPRIFLGERSQPL